ncbi:hypothetical protein MCAP1_000737 [Malassezia caprae]|uniref:SAP domain-containing protein n=1 Tax=Malassezia caprae TaxID=1381934 RepID=A0AAF0IVH6_9BASI|nr:hypothetical protein MCAP1_000737 [Malassezia caprae]
MEAQLQSLKVPELKELLQAADLPVSGNKADLIKRLLENPKATASLESSTGDAPAPSEPTPAQSTEKNEATSETVTKESAPEAATQPAEKQGEQPATSSEPTMEARTEALLAELEKRKARAVRFGQPYEELEKRITRIRKFGMEAEDGEDTGRLDSELKKSRPKAAASQPPAKTAAPTPAPSEPAVDAEELERRKRRAERFGLVPTDNSEKKARVA